MAEFKIGVVTAGNLSEYSTSQIKEEPMLFRAEYDFAWKVGGPITREFLTKLPHSNFSIDSRTHMLMPGWYPCIPGWHLDNVERDKNGKVMWKERKETDEHYITVVGDCSLTEYITEPQCLIIDDPPESENAYEWFDKKINELNMKKLITIKNAQANEIVKIGCNDFHRGVPAKKRGWRFFIRASKNDNRKFENEIRKQVQVYIPTEYKGW